MRIALFGGTFNPIHLGHLAIAQGARACLGLTRVLFIPSGQPPHKLEGEFVSAHHRLAMTRLATVFEPAFEVSDVEVRLPGPSYSINTVEAVRRQYGQTVELSLLMGLDVFLEIQGWKDADRLLSLCHVIVVSRPGYRFAQLVSLPLGPPWPTAALAALDTGERDQVGLPLGAGTTLSLLHLPPCTTSSTHVRTQLAKGEDVAPHLPPEVESYILTHHLYTGRRAS